MSTYNLLNRALLEIAASATMGAAYDSWSDEYCRKEVKEAWRGVGPFRKEPRRKVTVAELQALTETELNMLGFGNWNGHIRLVPLWAFKTIADGETLISIDNTTAVVGQQDNIDTDVRGGCMAYGFAYYTQDKVWWCY